MVEGDKVIAQALDVHPSVIWPSRYFDARGGLVEKILRGNKLTQRSARKSHLSRVCFMAGDSLQNAGC